MNEEDISISYEYERGGNNKEEEEDGKSTTTTTKQYQSNVPIFIYYMLKRQIEPKCLIYSIIPTRPWAKTSSSYSTLSGASPRKRIPLCNFGIRPPSLTSGNLCM